MDMIPVNSAAMVAVGYDPERRLMKITFAQGHTYDFCDVPRQVFDELMRAASKGTYYNQSIKDRYPC
jgi:hypothetical protein